MPPAPTSARRTGEQQEVNMDGDARVDIVWRNVALFTYLHLAAFYGGYLLITGQVMWQTFLWGVILHTMSGFGITAGAHRYWAHKSYKAVTPLRLLLAYMQTLAFQNHIYEWCRDHRVHHKFAETHADPHNAKRGFFFSHMGWLLCKKHEAVKVKGKSVDMSDLEQDPIVMFQKKYYLPLVLTISFVIPTIVPSYFWGETASTAFLFAAMFRYCVTLHCTWLVNSAAHRWGPRPYDKSISPAENKSVAWWAFGEGWHNYHHVFPWDYKTSEVGIYRYNFSAAFIDYMAKVGWAYDLKTVPEKLVKQRVARTGDGSHPDHIHAGPWGWGDKDIPEDDEKVTEILHKRNEE
ncbi:Acyl-CoA Delta(11) desaturase [Orchesella cincta]|uniref:Acyl-CoA Delta(11) desaturase n=1 Tax=Orchesella cincta TaxID=48709 RepID=A0A1D2MTL3_ORCCI|nr:Acyl-CoA Delta(11) desaturase [Orchesella cincta]